MIVIDASVAIQWFVAEPGSRQAEAILARDDVKAAPEHILVEVGQALLRHRRARRITLEDCREALSKLREWLDLLPTESYAFEALDLAAAAGCSVHDALYVAVAERADATLVTADGRLRVSLTGTPWQGRISLIAADS